MLDISQRRYQVLGTAWLAWFVNYIDRTKTAALLPLIIASLAMTTQQTGWVLFAFFIGYAAVQPPVARKKAPVSSIAFGWRKAGATQTTCASAFACTRQGNPSQVAHRMQALFCGFCSSSIMPTGSGNGRCPARARSSESCWMRGSCDTAGYG